VLENKHIIFDGGMGSMLEGKIPENTLPEELNLTNPELIESIHAAYVAAGANYITTNTFGASRILLKTEGKEDLAPEINRAAVQIAKKAAGTKAKVVGDMGPTSFLPTLGQKSFDEMYDSYFEQASILVDEGVDALIIETCQDILQTKIALIAAKKAIANTQTKVFVSVTLEKNGSMLLGTSLDAVLAILAPFKPDALGLNCATGPTEMEANLKYFSENSPFPIICQPNAGLPLVTEDGTIYPMGAKEFGEKVKELANKYGIEMVGGCCGTTPEYTAELSKNLSDTDCKKRSPNFKPALASLFSSVTLDQEPTPLIFAEQTNVNGSIKFRKLIENEDYDAAIDFAKKSSKAAHGLDVNLSTATGDEIKCFSNFLPPLVKTVDSAIMIDSTNPESIETALKLIPGRPIINSYNLDDIENIAKPILKLAKTYGAALISLTIDDQGMAMDAKSKLDVSKRLQDLAHEFGLSNDDIIIDTLTFSLASGDSTKDSAVESLKAIKKLKKSSRTILGVSNISYGLPKETRPALTSIFLNHALESGLSAAIINPKKLVPYSSIPENLKKAGDKLIDGDQSALKEFLNVDSTIKIKSEKPKNPKDALRLAILSGERSGLGEIIKNLISDNKSQKIIDEIMLPAMGEVSEMFSNGKMPLPFVLESAETMKKAMDELSPFMDESATSRGKIVLATVRGDIHDIGKNLVDIILTHNGFEVVNLGVKQTIENVLNAANENNATAIGLSALLTTSAKALADDIPYLTKHNSNLPVLVGGAAINDNFVNDMLKKSYSNVIYCPNAVSGLREMEKLVKI